MIDITKIQTEINQALGMCLPSTHDDPRINQLLQAMHYSLHAPAKRLRPILTLLTAQLYGTDWLQAMPSACAIEIVHTYSLIHDDLPMMDNDDLRRGQATCHRQYDEATAILAGDTMQALAYEVLVKGSISAGIPPEIINQLVLELSQSSGLDGMAGGQMMDLMLEGENINHSTLEQIHRRKTGALLCCAVRCGALAMKASETDLEHLTNYAWHLGLLFQIIDDILDVTGSTDALGKTVGADQLREKSTYPRIVGIDQSRSLAEECYQRALVALEVFGSSAEGLKWALTYVKERDN